MGMSRTLKFCLRIKYSSRSSGPSNASRKISSASGGMYRSAGSFQSGSPYKCANATPSITLGVESVVGAASAAAAARSWEPLTVTVCSEVLVIDVRRLFHARRFQVGIFVEINGLLVPQQRTPVTLFGFK